MDNDPDYFQVNHVSLVLNPFIQKIPSKSKQFKQHRYEFRNFNNWELPFKHYTRFSHFSRAACTTSGNMKYGNASDLCCSFLEYSQSNKIGYKNTTVMPESQRKTKCQTF